MHQPLQAESQSTISYEEVKSLSTRFLLPIKIIYELHSEFNCLYRLAKSPSKVKEQMLERQKSRVLSLQQYFENQIHTQGEDAPALEGEEIAIPVERFKEACLELKELHTEVSDQFLNAVGVNIKGFAPKVDWLTYLKTQCLLKYFTATREMYTDFWIKFMNPNEEPTIPRHRIERLLELLARGAFTVDSTLVSETFAAKFIEMLRKKDIVVGIGNDEVVDTRKFKMKIRKGDLDIEYLNQLLKSDNQYVVEGDEEDV